MTLIQGSVLKRKWKKIGFWQDIRGFFYARNQLHVFSKHENSFLPLIHGRKKWKWNRNSTIEKLIKNHNLPLFRTRGAFSYSGVRAIDSPHQIIPIGIIFRKKFRVQNSLKFHFLGIHCIYDFYAKLKHFAKWVISDHVRHKNSPILEFKFLK